MKDQKQPLQKRQIYQIPEQIRQKSRSFSIQFQQFIPETFECMPSKEVLQIYAQDLLNLDINIERQNLWVKKQGVRITAHFPDEKMSYKSPQRIIPNEERFRQFKLNVGLNIPKEFAEYMHGEAFDLKQKPLAQLKTKLKPNDFKSILSNTSLHLLAYQAGFKKEFSDKGKHEKSQANEFQNLLERIFESQHNHIARLLEENWAIQDYRQKFNVTPIKSTKSKDRNLQIKSKQRQIQDDKSL